MSLQKKDSGQVTFADVGLQTITFDTSDEVAALIVELIDTAWVQRLRRIRQTGNTNLVYMYAEHSRFGHSLAVAYLALTLMNSLRRRTPETVDKYRMAVAAAALLHDIGHVAPGSHLAARVWAPNQPDLHETVSARIIEDDNEISSILKRFSPTLIADICAILREEATIPTWTKEILSGSGWNIDRGNWTIVDSIMCAVSYGKYNVRALSEAYQIVADGRIAIHESRLDALTHFYVARDSMYRQVYQHRVLQAADALTCSIVQRLRDLLADQDKSIFNKLSIKIDPVMLAVIATENYAAELSAEQLFAMTESWWFYHLENWCHAKDEVLKDLCLRLRDRRLLKTIRLGLGSAEQDLDLEAKVKDKLKELGFNSRYYFSIVENTDKHRKPIESEPLVILDNGQVQGACKIEPLIASLIKPPAITRRWLVVPEEVKRSLSLLR